MHADGMKVERSIARATNIGPLLQLAFLIGRLHDKSAKLFLHVPPPEGLNARIKDEVLFEITLRASICGQYLKLFRGLDTIAIRYEDLMLNPRLHQ